MMDKNPQLSSKDWKFVSATVKPVQKELGVACAGSFKKSFTNLKAYTNLFKGHVQCLNYHSVTRYTYCYLGLLRFNATSTGNAGCFKKRITMIFQMLLCGEFYKSFILKGVQATQR
jgi:hypothetical protein